MRALALLLFLGACGSIEPRDPAAEKRAEATVRATAAKLRRACGSQDSFERLKGLAFREAAAVRKARSPDLERLARASVVRMEEPVVRSRDEALGVTVCAGRLILELPPGVQDVFDGDRRLVADVEYAAQEAADGSGLVFRMRGAEPIVYRLAAVDLPARVAAPEVELTAVATAEPVATSEPEPTRVVVAEPLPAPTRIAAPVARPTRVVARSTPTARPTRKAARPTPGARPTRVAARPASRPTRFAARPSFDCRYARGRVERMVCGDETLARADRRMAAVFERARAEGDGEVRRELERSRGRFLAFRDRCGSAPCVLQAYEDRVAEIGDIGAGDF